jgi:NAD(P)-dependent dehydrogenase (short-subunit alcohol dehydrogenase family)
MNFSDKTVVVTGAGAGVGRAIAIGFCSDGANVVGFARNRSDLEETARLCSAGKIHIVDGDVSKPDDVRRLFSEAADRFGKVDILVNNAAVYPKVEFLASSHEEWSRAIEINVIGMALCCRMALPGMLERGFGRIINLGSFAWRRPIPKSSGYSVSKGAVGPLTKALATEIDRDKYPDVLINEFMPGIIKTRMSDSGEDPDAVYPHARFVVSLPRGGPTGQTFVQSTPYVEHIGRRARLKRWLATSLGLVKG